MIEFRMADWRTNASLLGLMNILDYGDKKYKLTNQGQILVIDKEVLQGFERDYFMYFVDNYQKSLPWYRIVDYKNSIKEHLDNLVGMSEEDLENINTHIDMVKDYMSRNNYKKIYEFIEGCSDIEKKVKSLKKINLRKDELVKDRLKDIETELKSLERIIGAIDSESAKEYMGAKGAIYNYINRGLTSGRGGISFLNPQTKERDIFADYKKYFLDSLLNYLGENKEKYKYNCFSCGESIRDLKTNMNLIKDTGFDSTRKSSYIWNHESDFAICSKCLFLYSCLSAGFYYSLSEGIFVNYNYDLEGLKRINKNLKKHSISEINRFENAASYRTLVNAIENEYQRHLEFEIRDMQIIRYREDEYRFNLLSKDALRIIRESKSDLNAISNASYREGRQYSVSIYDLTLDRIFNNQNLFSLIHYLTVNLISKTVGIRKYYNIYHVSRLLNINSRIIKEGNVMVGGKNIGKLTDSSRTSGYYLRKNYNAYMKDLSRVDNRMKSITYKMTNALKTNNSGSFMDILINSYAYIGQPIPMHLVEALKNSEKLRTVGYAFVAGINSYEKDKGGNKDEE